MSADPLYKSIAAKLAGDIRSGLLSGEFLPPESSLCRSFKASRITIRGALKLLENEKLVEAVPGKGRRLVRPGEAFASSNRSPSSKLKRRLRINCAVQYGSGNNAYQVVFNAINNISMDEGHLCSVHFIDSNLGVSSFERTLSPDCSDGLICVGLRYLKLLERIESCGVPVVHINCDYGLAAHQVSTDNYAGGYMVGAHFASRGIKNAMVLYRNGDAGSFEFESRVFGFRRAFSDVFGSACEIDSLCITPGSSAAVAEYFKKSRPGAVFMVTDKLTMELLEGLAQHGLSYPKDVSIAGFDNMLNTPEKWQREIDSIDQPWALMSKIAFQRLEELIASGKEAQPFKLLLPPKLVVKGSVA